MITRNTSEKIEVGSFPVQGFDRGESMDLEAGDSGAVKLRLRGE
jgi:hypothetical protein